MKVKRLRNRVTLDGKSGSWSSVGKKLVVLPKSEKSSFRLTSN